MSEPNASVAQESLASWSTNAAHWDERMGHDGNLYWKVLLEPTLERFLGQHLQPGARALDIATGNGVCARWMAAHGAEVIATDGAPQMLAVAKKHAGGEKIDFRQLDVTDQDAFNDVIDVAAKVRELSHGLELCLLLLL